MKFTYNSDDGIAVIDGVAVKVATQPTDDIRAVAWNGEVGKIEYLNGKQGKITDLKAFASILTEHAAIIAVREAEANLPPEPDPLEARLAAIEDRLTALEKLK